MSKEILVEQHHVLSFQSNVQLSTQYNGSKLRPYVTEMQCEGEGAVAANLIDPIKAQRVSGRIRSNIEVDAERRRRWLIYRDPIKVGAYIDRMDVFRQTQEPTSELVLNGTRAIGKAIDMTILGLDIDDGKIADGGLLGAIVEGKRPGGAGVGLPSGNTIVHGGTGLTISKMRKARKDMGLAEVDLDRMTPIMGITTNQHDDLLGIVEAGTGDLNQLEQPQLRDGKVTRLMGFQFLEVNILPKTGTTRSCPVWVPSAIKLGVWQDVSARMWNDTNADNLPYWTIDTYMDATRIEDVGVRVIECTEA